MAQDTAAMSTSIKLLTDLLFPSLPADAREPLSPSLRTELSTAALEWMETRSPGQPKIRIRTVTDGGAAFAILEVLNDDMPFLVDSVIGEVQARGLAIRLVLHPILKVQRRPDGILDAIVGAVTQVAVTGPDRKSVV